MEGAYHDYPKQPAALGPKDYGISAAPSLNRPSNSRDQITALAVPAAVGNLSHRIERLSKTASDVLTRLESAGVLRPPSPSNQTASGVAPAACGLQGVIDEKATQVDAVAHLLRDILERLEV